MQDTKGEGESFREYFQRAKRDAGVRRQIMMNARYGRKCTGWLAIVLLGLVVWQTLALGLNGRGWVSTRSIASAILFVLNMMIYAKFGDRIAALKAMDGPGDSAR